MIETINGKAYLKKGDKVYELGGGSNIITADSVEQLPDPASMPEGTIAFVKSEESAGGGLPTITLTTPLMPYVTTPLSDDESAAITAVAAIGETYGTPIVLNCMAHLEGVDEDPVPISVVMPRFYNGTEYQYTIISGQILVIAMGDTGWIGGIYNE